MSPAHNPLESLVEPGGCEQHPTAGRIGTYCLSCVIIPASSGVKVGDALFPETPAAPERLTVDTITSNDLDALQLRAARMEHATEQAAELAVRLEDTERERDALRQVLHLLRYGIARANDAQLAAAYVVELIDTTTETVMGRAPDPCDRDQQYARAERAEAAIEGVRNLHRKASHGDTCVYCAHGQRLGYDTTWPCDTIRALGEPSGQGDDTTRIIVDRPFRSHRTPGCTCTYGQRCPNCRD